VLRVVIVVIVVDGRVAGARGKFGNKHCATELDVKLVLGAWC
jgi:hypothetical protein